MPIDKALDVMDEVCDIVIGDFKGKGSRESAVRVHVAFETIKNAVSSPLVQSIAKASDVETEKVDTVEADEGSDAVS